MSKAIAAIVMISTILNLALLKAPHDACFPFYKSLSVLSRSNTQVIAELESTNKKLLQFDEIKLGDNIKTALANFVFISEEGVTHHQRIADEAALQAEIEKTIADFVAGSPPRKLAALFRSLRNIFKVFLVDKCVRDRKTINLKVAGLLKKLVDPSMSRRDRRQFKVEFVLAQQQFSDWLVQYLDTLNTFQCSCKEANAFNILKSRLDQIFRKLNKNPGFLNEKTSQELFDRIIAITSVLFRLQNVDQLSFIENLFDNAIMFKDEASSAANNAFFVRVLKALLLGVSDVYTKEQVGLTVLRTIYKRMSYVMDTYPIVHDFVTAKCKDRCSFNFADPLSTKLSQLLLLEQAFTVVVFSQAFDKISERSEVVKYDNAILSEPQVKTLLDNFEAALNFDAGLLRNLNGAVPLFSSVELLVSDSQMFKLSEMDSKESATREQLLVSALDLINLFLAKTDADVSDQKNFVDEFNLFLENCDKSDQDFAKHEQIVRVWNLVSYYNLHQVDSTFKWEAESPRASSSAPSTTGSSTTSSRNSTRSSRTPSPTPSTSST